jgi:hypothetical protein
MIYDCFIFFNELDLLEMRLKILDGYVDKFVLVEAATTFSGKPKPFHFGENKRRFYPYIDKVIHISLEDVPKSQNSWAIERFQRNKISQGLVKCSPDDIILISDVDEIPNPDVIKRYVPGSGINVLVQSLYYYYLNYRCATVGNGLIPWRKPNRWVSWSLAKICQFKDIKSDIETMRTSRRYKYNMMYPRIMNGGWHFAYMGGIERIIEKLESFSHKEYDTDYFKDSSRIAKAIEENRDLYDRNYQYIKVPIDENYPKYIRENIPLLKEKGLIL